MGFPSGLPTGAWAAAARPANAAARKAEAEKRIVMLCMGLATAQEDAQEDAQVREK